VYRTVFACRSVLPSLSVTTSLTIQSRGIPLSVFPKEATSELVGLVSTLF